MGGIFADEKDKLFTRYAVTIKTRDRLMGGTPKDPKIITAWLRTKTGVTDEEELRRMLLRTLEELGVEVPAEASYEELVKASEALANRQAVGFKRQKNGRPYWESRCVKAMLKEVINSQFAGLRWPIRPGDPKTTTKAPKSATAENVVVRPDVIDLGVEDVTDTQLFVGHTTGPQGPQSNLTYYEYIEGATLHFEVWVANNLVDFPTWKIIWNKAEEMGMGALRSQGFGTFDILQWERLN